MGSKMTEESLAHFDRNFEAWSSVHPRDWLAATERQSATDFLSEQTRKLISAQLQSADRIIVSQERVASRIDEVAVETARIANGVEGLASAFEWGFSEVVWQLEEQRTVLQEILEVLRVPLYTQARELRNRAADAYRNAWFDEALEDFLESEKQNPYDFTTHQNLGNIYFFHKKDPQKALEYYTKAAKYSTPKSRYHASLALLHRGLVKYVQEDFEGAYKDASKATELSPSLSEAHYQCAQYCAKLGNYDDALERLCQAVERDRNYCLKIQSDADFAAMKEELRSFFEDLQHQAENEAREEVSKTQELVALAEGYGVTGSHKFIAAQQLHKDAKDLLARRSLFDCWDARAKAWDAQEATLDALEDCISGQISRISEENTVALENLENGKTWTAGILLILLLALHILAYILQAIESFERHPGEGVLWLIFGAILLVIGYTINALILAGIYFMVAWPIIYSLKKHTTTRYEKAAAELQKKLSRIEGERSELNWQYK